MVKQNTVAGKDSVAFAIINSHPVSIDLRGPIGTAWIKRRRLALRHLLNLTVHLRTARLIELRLQPSLSNRLQNSYGPHASYIPRVFRDVETHPHMSLRRQVVNFIRLNSIEQFDQIR